MRGDHTRPRASPRAPPARGGEPPARPTAAVPPPLLWLLFNLVTSELRDGAPQTLAVPRGLPRAPQSRWDLAGAGFVLNRILTSLLPPLSLFPSRRTYVTRGWGGGGTGQALKPSPPPSHVRVWYQRKFCLSFLFFLFPFLYKKAEVEPTTAQPPPPTRALRWGGSAELFLGVGEEIGPSYLNVFLVVYLLCAEARGVSTEKPPGSDGSS